MRTLQLIDSLHPGGAERMAVNLANVLSKKIEKSYLCVTRQEGLLYENLSENVEYLFLNKKNKFDIFALYKLGRFVSKNQVDIIHAHSSSFYFGTLVKWFNPKVKLIWHDHYGNSEMLNARPFRILRLCSRVFSKVYCVNDHLVKWNSKKLHTDQVAYLPNFAVEAKGEGKTQLKGKDGKRILCLANLRPQKDHFTLIKAFDGLVQKHPDWSLHLVGKDFNDNYAKLVKQLISDLKLNNNVFVYGAKQDIGYIMNQAATGVLSSRSEGLPLALLEYGLGKLPVVATNVGDCEKIIKPDENGLLVEPEDVNALKQALLKYIRDEGFRYQMGSKLFEHVCDNFSTDAISDTLVSDYKQITTS